MPAKNPRVNVDVRNALEMHENVVLTEIAAERERTIDQTKTLTHDAVWRRRLRRK